MAFDEDENSRILGKQIMRIDMDYWPWNLAYQI